jgi:hypothetical protein
MIKFKVGFTITPEVLFGIIAKVLPLEDLHIEQMVETPTPTQPTLSHEWKHDWKLSKPKRKNKKYTRSKPSIPMDLDKGINKIILTALQTRPHKGTELRPLLTSEGYSPNSVGSRLQSLEEKGFIESMDNGYWRLSVDELKKTYTEESA